MSIIINVMGSQFEVTDHTADIGIIARGRDLNELFASAAGGMLHLLIDEQAIKPDVRREVSLASGDVETLLVEWLNELLYLLDTERLLLREFDIVIEGTSLRAQCRGIVMDHRRHKLQREIKAATYHDLKVKNMNGLYEVKVIFDI